MHIGKIVHINISSIAYSEIKGNPLFFSGAAIFSQKKHAADGMLYFRMNGRNLFCQLGKAVFTNIFLFEERNISAGAAKNTG